MVKAILHKKLGLEPEYTPFSWQNGLPKPMMSKIEDVDINTLYDVLKRSPEVVASINAIVEDILSDGWKFEGSKSPINKAEKFVEESKFYKVLANALYDLVLTGNGYILKLSVKEERLNKLLEKITSKMVTKGKGKKEKEVEKTIYELKQVEGKKPKDLQNLKASTIKIDYDEHGRVKKYIQKVGNDEIKINPDEMLHLSKINLGGGVYGFSDLEPLLSDIATLIFAKEYAGKYFENDGVPNFMINLPEAMGEEDRNYQVLVQQLKELKKKENKWKALITTGQTNIEQIKPFDADMQYPELIKHFTRVVLMAMGVPPHRVNFTADIKGDANQMRAYEGYFKKINFLQKIVEETVNTEIFSHFGDVKLRFNRTYKIDELREANIIAILADRNLITQEEARQLMSMEEDMDGTPVGQVGQDRSTRALRGEDTRKPEDEELSENEEEKPDNKIKSGRTVTKLHKKYDNAKEVNFDDFIRLVERVVQFDKANVLYQETNDEFVVYFHDGKWAYKSRISKNELNDVDEFKFYYLRNAIKVLI